MQVGYVRLSSFNARAQPDVAAALQSLRDRGAQAFVLDLRDNRGGLVNQGVEVAKLFLDSAWWWCLLWWYLQWWCRTTALMVYTMEAPAQAVVH